MAHPNVDKWTPFMLSLMVPGAGQLLAGSWSAVAWLLAAGSLAAVGSTWSAAGMSGASCVGKKELATPSAIFRPVVAAEGFRTCS